MIVTMDDATSTIYSAFLVEEEGTASSFRGLQETFVAKGLPASAHFRRSVLDADDLDTILALTSRFFSPHAEAA